MIRNLMLPLALIALASFGTRATAEDDEIRQRRRTIEVAFADRYVKIAKDARRLKAADLTRAAFERAERLDPGNDSVIEFDPMVEGGVSASSERRLAKLEKTWNATRLAEAKARLDLAIWLDEEAWVEEAKHEVVTALALSPGVTTFDAEGILTAPGLGEIPKTLSLAALEEHDVYRGRLLPLAEIPPCVPWSEGWKLTTKHFLIQTNVSPRLCRETGRALDAARPIFLDESGFEVDGRVTVYVLAARKDFEEYIFRLTGERPTPGNRGKCVKDLCVVDGSRSQHQAISTAIHEMAHGYYNLGHEKLVGHDGVNMPVWFAEGFATYCAGYGEDSLSYERGIVDPRLGRDAPLKRFQTLVRLGEGRRLREFMAHEEGDSLFYYQACAFYWFFKETGDEALRELFRKSIKAVAEAGLAGEDRNPAGTGIFVKEMGGDLSFIEEAFFAWVGGLSFEE